MALENETNVYGSRYYQLNPKDVIFSYRAPSGYTFQDHWDGSKLDNQVYPFSWRQKVWNCPLPLKSPVGFLKSRRKFEFALEMDKDGSSQRYDHVIGRQKIFFNEYVRLVYHLPIVNELREMHQNGINILLCSNDVVKT
ncbi:unnamed protein product [Brachionus calyciflorus]|uniref:Uncharacterized protein n=1 Tax=Brachionus calyciflorus TaxID=104777 RepID=A0A814B7T9_9BILA|nr:unnamed protein product [Brachionus calyciflorus]